MEKIVIEGGRPLHGEVDIHGMKNAALPIILASILTGDKCVIEHLPAISDVTLALEILRSMGAGVKMINRTTVEIDSSHIKCGNSPYDLEAR